MIISLRQMIVHPGTVAALVIIFCLGVSVSFSLGNVQSEPSSGPRNQELDSLVAPGKHLRVKVDHLIGANGPVTFDITPGEENVRGARICTVGIKPRSCYVSRCDYLKYDVVLKAGLLEIAPRQRVLLLWTGSNAYYETRIVPSLISMGPKGKLVNLLPDREIGPEEEWKLWSDPAVSSYLLVSVTESFLVSENPDRYRYDISTYEYCPGLGRYVEANLIALAKIFPRHDPRHKENFFINKAMPVIKARLLRRKSKCAARKST